MRFFTTTQALGAALAFTGATADFIPKETYLANIAPGVLRHLSQFRQGKSNLTLSQTATLDLAAQVVNTYATDQIAVVETLCYAAFDKDDCVELGTGGDITAGLKSSRTYVFCQCSTTDPYCGTECCLRGADKCQIQESGCGFLYTYLCDGLCGPGTCVI